MKTLHYSIIAVSVSLALITFLQPIHAQDISIDKKNATLIVNFNSSEFNGYQGGSFTPSHDGSMYAYSTSIKDPKSGNWKTSLWLYFLKNDTNRSLDLNSDLSQILDISFSSDDKKLLFVGNGCDSNPSHTTFYMFNLLDIHLKCNSLTNVHSADWMPDGSIVFLQNNEENDTVSIYQNSTQKLLYTKQITPPYISLNSSHIEFIKASPDGKKIALWYFVMLSHKTQILNVDDGKITDTFDGGHPRWSQDDKTLLYSIPTSTGYYTNGPRKSMTYVNLLDVNSNKTVNVDTVSIGIDDLSLSDDSKNVFYVIKVPQPYNFLNFTSGIYKIDLNHNDNYILGSGPRSHNFSTTDNTPLQQFKSGIDLFDIKCNNGLQRVVRYQDELPLCVKFEHIQKMQTRGMNLLLYAQDSAPKELTVEGFQDSYKIGTKIDFTIKFKGIGYSCSSPVVFVTDSSSRIVWVSHMPVLLCDPDEKIGYKEVEWKVADLGDLKINDNSGSYRLIVMFNDETFTKDFWINSQESHIIIPSGFSENKKNFEPKDITVKVGINESVVWQNDDTVEHRIIADNYNDPGFYEITHFDPQNESTIKGGQHFVHYFLTTAFGTFGYHSESGQHGTVTVLPPDNQLTELQIQHSEPPLEHHYSNDRIAIMKGTKVSWDNIDNVTHTITSKIGVFDSGLIPPRTRFTLDTTQLKPGYYDYFDKLNPSLDGGIRVVEPMINESYNKILIEKAKETKESQMFLKKYLDAMTYVENNYYDVVKLAVEKQVYPAGMNDGGTRTLELAIEFDPFHNVKNTFIVCGGPISLMASNVTGYLESEKCLKPNS